MKSLPGPHGQRCLALENFLKSTTPMVGTSKLQKLISAFCVPHFGNKFNSRESIYKVDENSKKID